ncbi:MAG: hypothetical protein LBD22_03530 [Spirochaetaceae bacterium]|jgi:hypothetical protein|nr:hypothetical protein [Spirochaetaceae bacterium]
MIDTPQVILLGSSGRNSGKTALAEYLIQHFKNTMPVIALKVTSIERHDSLCPRGGAGCGACSLDGSDFMLSEETAAGTIKDTQRLLAAGAARVFWLRSLRSALKTAFCTFLEAIPSNALLICESNSLRRYIQPALFIMLRTNGSAVKPSAQEVASLASVSLDFPWEETQLEQVMCSVKTALEQKK